MSVHLVPDGPRHAGGLSERIFAAFCHACDDRDFQVAEQLLHVMEMTLGRSPLADGQDRRTDAGSLVAAYERLSLSRRAGTDAREAPPAPECSQSASR
jgi:hypothetical protein